MKLLHILRSLPDETVKSLMLSFSEHEEIIVPLYEDDVDWEKLVDEIFKADKVISWW